MRSLFSRPLLLLIALVLFCSHNLYIKSNSYFLKPNQNAVLSLYNGTFEKSENIIARDRMLDASMVANGKRVAIDTVQWIDLDSSITQLPFKTGDAGTYVVGVSTEARNIELSAEKFNDYLEHDGVLDMLQKRQIENKLDQEALESYQKHVKAIYQVGDVKTEDWKTVLNYPIEFVPTENPYHKYTGDQLAVQLLLDGKPLANQLVYADYIKVEHDHDHGDHEHHEHDHSHKDVHDHDHDHSHADDHSHEHDHSHSHEHEHDKAEHDHEHQDGHSHEHDHKGKSHSHEHEHDDAEHDHNHAEGHSHEHGSQDHHNHDSANEGHSHNSGQQLRTDTQGIVSVQLPEDGLYYLRTIHMVETPEEDELTHLSKWATLTFEVTHKHDHSTHSHDHDHLHEEGLPDWVFIVISILIIGLLFFAFRKK